MADLEGSNNTSSAGTEVKQPEPAKTNDWFKEPMSVKSPFVEKSTNENEDGAEELNPPEADPKGQSAKDGIDSDDPTNDGKGTDDISDFEKLKQELSEDGIDINKFKSEKDLAKAYSELTKKFTEKSQKLAELEKGNTETDKSELEEKKGEQEEKDLMSEMKTALEEYDFDKAGQLFSKMSEKVERLEKVLSSVEERNKAEQDKADKLNADNFRLDTVENTFDKFVKENKLNNNSANEIREFMRGEGKYQNEDMLELFQDLLVKDINAENQQQYSDKVKKAFKTVMTFINAQKEKDNFQTVAEKAAKGQVVTQPRGTQQPAIPKKKGWFYS